MTPVSDPVPLEVKAELRKVFPPSARIETRFPIMMNMGPSPHWVEVLLDALTWKAFLGVSATVFLNQLAKNAADDVWQNKAKIGSILRDKAFSTLADVCFAIAVANETIKSGGVHVGVPCQDRYWDAQTSLGGSAPEEICVALARFVVSAEKIQALVEREKPTYPLFGPVRIVIEPEGKVTVYWNHVEGTVFFTAVPDGDFLKDI